MNCSLTKLRPCANCGNDHVRLVRNIIDDVPSWYVECIDCGMRTASYDEVCLDGASYSEVMKSIDDAVDCCVSSWNTRVDDCKRCDCRNDLDDDTKRVDNKDMNNKPDYLCMNDVMDSLDKLCDMAHKLCNKQ